MIIIDEVFELTHLTQLDLSANQITELPEAIGNLTNLTKLNLSSISKSNSHKYISIISYLMGNRITELPETIGNLTNSNITSY